MDFCAASATVLANASRATVLARVSVSGRCVDLGRPGWVLESADSAPSIIYRPKAIRASVKVLFPIEKYTRSVDFAIGALTWGWRFFEPFADYLALPRGSPFQQGRGSPPVGLSLNETCW